MRKERVYSGKPSRKKERYRVVLKDEWVGGRNGGGG